MGTTLILVGVACMIGAIIGGGLKFTTIMEMGKLDSLWRQFLLAAFGACLVAFGLAQGGSILPSTSEVAQGGHSAADGDAPVAASPSSKTDAAKAVPTIPPHDQDTGNSSTSQSRQGVDTGKPFDPSKTASPPDYSGPWVDQLDQKVAIVQTGSNVSLQWHDGNQTLRVDGAMDERGQFSGTGDSTHPTCNGSFQDGAHIGIVCIGISEPSVINWHFRLLRASQ